MTLHIQTHHDVNVLDELESEWNRLQATSYADSLFISWDWISIWWTHYSRKQDNLWLITAHDDDDLIGIAPLMIVNHHEARGINWRQLEFISAEAPVDHWDFIIEKGYEDVVIPAFLDEIQHHKHGWDVLELSNILPDSPTVEILRKASFSWDEHDGHITPYISLPNQFDDLFSTLSSNKRQQQRRHMRKMEKTVDKWSFEAVHGDDVVGFFQKLVDHHQSKWEALGETGAFKKASDVQFHMDVVQRFDQKKWLRLFCLKFDDDIAGLLYMFAYRGRMYYFNSGLNEQYEHLRTGHILHELAIRAAIDEGLQEYDFMWGDERYKYSWGANHRVDRTFTWYASIKGKTLHQAVVFARMAKARIKAIRDASHHDDPIEESTT